MQILESRSHGRRVLKFGQQELQLTSRRHNRRLRRSKESKAKGDGNTDEVAETRQQTANAKKPARPLAVPDVQSLKVDHKELKKMQKEDESLKPLWKKVSSKEVQDLPAVRAVKEPFILPDFGMQGQSGKSVKNVGYSCAVAG
nr:hypothetical protein BaRGS_030455 [Batillaria attramentaria]